MTTPVAAIAAGNGQLGSGRHLIVEGPDDEPTAVERLEAEVDNEPQPEPEPETEELPDGVVEVALCDDVVRVLPADQWRSSAMRALNTGNFDTWAEKCLYGDDYAEVWAELDPTNGEVEAFFKAYGEASGQSSPESRAERRRSLRTQRR